ncbi:hypothetical protein STCU_06801 [Strigomonas culicis]|nr:hypothetical protein STCU_06801 [Strigomonas culicis]|eukprot:EPY25183.1 hypothetical protein STCU_06801 [Strigomonas culicis]
MHLFELSHREPICVDVLSGQLFAISDERLRWVQQELSLVEVCRRQSEFEEVFQHCQALADYFEGERDLEEAAWHYLAALRYAQESLDRALEQRTRRALAAFYERHGRYADAAAQFEAMYSLASALGDADVARDACVDLARLYHIQGEQLLPVDPEAARVFFEKESRAAQRSKSGREESRALDALGRASEQAGHLEKALQYHSTSRYVAQREHLEEREVEAALRAAALEERLGRSEAATASLQSALELAKKLRDPAKVCQATMQLGEVYRAQQQARHDAGDTEGEEECMRYRTTCFREAFGAACASGQQDLIDATRIAMGFAIGEYYFKKAGDGRGYIPIVCDDIKAQLEWMSNGKL